MRKYSVFVALLAGLLINPVPAWAAITPGDGTCDLTVGAGTSASPFQITDAATLAEIIDCDEPAEKAVGETPHVFKLMNNIDATSMGQIKDSDATKYFIGILDGNNQTISNISQTLSSDGGLFHKIDGTVKDLTIAGNVSSVALSQGASFGALAAWTYSQAVVDNVTSSVVVDALDATGTAGALEVGGLIGTMTGGSLTDVTVSGIVQGRSSVGGVVGRAYGTVTITNARKTSGAVTARIDASGFATAGGIIGNSGSSVQLVDIESQVPVLSKDNVNGDYVGGLVGRLEGSLNVGKMSGASTILGGNATGGAVGFLYGGSMSKVEVQASVDVYSNTTGVGGLVGIGGRGGSISESFSLADVRGYNSSVNGPQERVGGLVGQVSDTAFFGAVTITDSFFAGAIIDGSTGTGGLVGYLDGDLEITRSYATPTINTTALTTGGLVGQTNTGSTITTLSAFWDVDVTGEATTALGAGTGLKTARFLDPENLSGFNFSTTWGYNSGLDAAYPRLRWTNTSGGYWASELGFTVLYDRNGGNGGTLPDSVTQATSSTLTVPTADVGIVKNGFTFGGWALSNSATSASSTVTFDADKSLFAVWLAETVAPTVTAAVLASNGTSLTITFSEPMGAKTAPLGFSVDVDGASAAFTSGNVVDSGISLVLTLGQAASFGDSVELSYDNSVGSLEDKAGTPNALATFAALSVTNNVADPNSNQAPAVSAPYTGPLLTTFSTRVLSPCEATEVTIAGVNLSGISATIQGKSVLVLQNTSTTLVLMFPAGLEVADSVSLQVSSPAGNITVPGAFNVLSTDCSIPESTAVTASWTKNLNDGTVKMYAKNIVGAGKVQFMLNGEEIAWVRAANTSDSKLREANGSYYLVRTVDLVEGQKNVLEIYLDGVRQTRTAYTY